MNLRSPLVIGISIALVIGVSIAETLRRRPTVQIPACFARMAEGFAQHDASAVMACIHPDYDFPRQWPQIFEQPDTARALAGQILAQLCLMGRNNTVELTWSLTDLRPLPDADNRGRWQAIATASISGDPFAHVTPKPLTLRIVLQRGSWLTGHWQIVDHDHFALPGAGNF